MNLRPVGRVMVRNVGRNPKTSTPSLGVTIPKVVRLFLDIKQGQIMEVFVDEENKRIVYQLIG